MSSGKASAASMAAMYQDALLAHHRAPHNRREMGDATSSAVHKNPVCGDEIRVMVRVDGDELVDVSFTGRGCSIATASASMMTDATVGHSAGEALKLVEQVEQMLAGGEVTLPDGLEPLRGVAPFAGRHGCARMPWAALREALAR